MYKDQDADVWEPNLTRVGQASQWAAIRGSPVGVYVMVRFSRQQIFLGISWTFGHG
jgi:hypothetical protein